MNQSPAQANQNIANTIKIGFDCITNNRAQYKIAAGMPITTSAGYTPNKHKINMIDRFLTELLSNTNLINRVNKLDITTAQILFNGEYK